VGVLAHAGARRRSEEVAIYKIAICAKNRVRIAKFFWLARGGVNLGYGADGLSLDV